MRAVLRLAAALLATSGGLHAQPPTDAQELEPITVKPQVSPLDEPYERLRRMMDDPHCDGCPPPIAADRASIYTRAYYGIGAVLSFFTGMPEHPPEMSPEERAAARVAGDWRMYERDPIR